MAVALRTGAFFGSVARRLDTPDAVVSEIAHGAARALPRHRHEAPYFCLLLRGGYVERIDGRDLEYRPFSVAFHPPGSVHEDRIGRGGAVFFSIELKAGSLETLGQGAARFDLEPRFLDADLCRLAVRLYALHAARAIDAETVDASLWELSACLSAEKRLHERSRPRWFDASVELVRAEFRRPIRVREVAGLVGVHPVHLAREFRRRAGESLGEYVHKIRVRAACRELEDPDRPLAQIALANGFADQSHFCRVFKSLVGCSPSRFRRLLTASRRASRKVSSIQDALPRSG